MKRENEKIKDQLKDIFRYYPEVLAVYLFGSSLNQDGISPNDVDLAVLFKQKPKDDVKYYMELFEKLTKIYIDTEVDLLFLHSAKLALVFEVISKGKILYCADDNLRTDFEDYITGEYLDFKFHINNAQRELYEGLMGGGLFV